MVQKMRTDRYPADLKITSKDFDDCGWKEIIEAISKEGYSRIWQAFTQAAEKAIEEGRLPHGKIFWLLADACSMTLRPESVTEPFKPMFVFEGKRSALPDDFSDEDIEFFSQIVDRIDDVWLKARLADLVWLKQKKRDVRFALAAIDAYCKIPLETETWIRGGRECWARAIQLALSLQKGAGNRLQEMEKDLVQAVKSATKDDGFFVLWLADLLYDNRLGRNDGLTIAHKLKFLAEEFDAEGDLHKSREYFGAAAKWFKIVGEEVLSIEMKIAEAEGWFKEAVARLSSDNPTHMVAATFFENAIQIYRTIPRKLRSSYRVDERISELRTHLSDSSKKALDEMGVIQTKPVDITKMVDESRKAVMNKPIEEALKVFCNLFPGINVKEAREQAIELLRNHPLQAFFPMTMMSRDGRVIAKRPGLSLSSDQEEKNEVTVRAEMIRNYEISIGLIVQGQILPALDVLRLEHRLREIDFIHLANQSPIVPKDRVQLFGKALFEGFDGDFITALHLLVPQIEHMVRYHLKQAGVQTTVLDAEGIENEVGMSALMERTETEQIFGPDLCFELRSLFCDPFGPNLRNVLAHGLLNDENVISIYSIYAWWFSLKMVFNTFWNRLYASNHEQRG